MTGTGVMGAQGVSANGSGASLGGDGVTELCLSCSKWKLYGAQDTLSKTVVLNIQLII